MSRHLACQWANFPVRQLQGTHGVDKRPLTDRTTERRKD